MGIAGQRRWYVLIATCLVVLVTNGLTLAGLTVFDASLLEALGIGRGELKLRDTIQLLVAAGAAPVVGMLADRYGVRPLMLGGALLIGGGLLAYSRVTSLAQVYAIHVVLGAGLASGGIVMCVAVVARWFAARRGLALGLVLAGASLGNALLPLLNSRLNLAYGWRQAFVLAALLPLLLVPLVLALVRERGTEPAPAAGATAAGPASLAALGSREFLLLALIAFCTFYSLVAVTTHLFLYFKDRGFADATAAASLTVMYLTGICGKLGAGALADVVGVKRAFAALLIVMFGGVMLLAASLGQTVWLAVAMTGLGWGGVYTLQQLVATELFAGPSLGRIVGTLVLIDSVGGALGPAVTGWLYDLHGSYDFALRAILVLLLLAGVTLAFLRVPNPRGRAS